MARILFVTDSAGGAVVGNLQHRSALRKSNGGFRIVLNSSLMRFVRMPPSSDDPHSVFLTDRSEAVPDKNNITVQGILEKSQTTVSAETGLSKASRPQKLA